ncbi:MULTISPECIES: DUF4403 family protein [Corallococcus]|uniref:DUF4403 family protein n=1 Tax=Corallococcus TaxID=83461 RepID=UPI00131580B0|nr:MULTISPECIES: DUF4403 family protein [Corallococcus]NPD21950.1 DUF4403 family protein [Corallococcus exiguus]
MGHLFRTLLATILMLGTMGWGARALAQDAPRPVEDSTVTVPVSLDLGAGRALLLQQLPNPLVAGKKRQKIPVHITTLVPTKVIVDVPRQKLIKVVEKVPTKVKIGLCLMNPSSCLSTIMVDKVVEKWVTVIEKVEQTLMKPVNSLNPFDVEVEYGAVATDVDFDLQGEVLSASVTIEAFVKAGLDASIVKVGALSCGVGEPKPRIRLTLTGPVRWSEAGALAFTQTGWKLDWERPCQLTALDIKAEDLLDLPVVRDLVRRNIESALSRLPASYSLQPTLAKAWETLGRPVSLHEGAWLQFHPVALAVGPLEGHGKTVSTVASLKARPTVTYGDQPSASVLPLPALDLVPPASRGFKLTVPCTVDLKMAETRLGPLLLNALSELRLPVQVDRVALRGDTQGALDVTLHLKDELVDRIRIRATPRFDPERQEIEIVNPVVTVEANDALKELFVPGTQALVLKTVGEWVRFPLDPIWRKSMQELRQASFRGEGYEVKVQTETLRLVELQVLPDTLRIVGHAEGTASGTFNL